MGLLPWHLGYSLTIYITHARHIYDIYSVYGTPSVSVYYQDTWQEHCNLEKLFIKRKITENRREDSWYTYCNK